MSHPAQQRPRRRPVVVALKVIAGLVTLVLLAAYLFAMTKLGDVRSRFAPLDYTAPKTAGPQTWVVIGEDEPITGTGKNPEAEDSRADIAILLTQTKHGLQVTSLPRDLLLRTAPGVPPQRLAVVWLRGPQVFGDSICDALGIPVDHLLRFNLQSFSKVVDGLGGVDVDLPYRLRQLGLFDLSPGVHTLDGRLAASFVRSRSGEAFIDGKWIQEPNGPAMRQRRSIQIFSAAIAKARRDPRTAARLAYAVAPGIGLDRNAAWMDFTTFLGYNGKASLLPAKTLNDVNVEISDDTRKAVRDLGYTGCRR